MKLLTWNINSVRLRLPLLGKVVEQMQPDIICLQETKVMDDLFPLDGIKALGFDHVYFKGMKGYNGVMIASKYPMTNTQEFQHCGQDDKRHIAVTIEKDSQNAFELHNLYIPAGGYEADPVINDKFQHKLDFVDEMTEWFNDRYQREDKIILVGDLNIAL